MEMVEHRKKLDDIWDRGIEDSFKMGWLLLEQEMRQVLRDYRHGEFPAQEAVLLIDEYIAARTLRGSELDDLRR